MIGTQEQQQMLYDLVKAKLKECDKQARELSTTSRELTNLKAQMLTANKDLV